MIDIRLHLLNKLFRKSYWGNRLCNISDLIKAVPKHRGKQAKIEADRMYKEGLLNRKPGNKSEFRYSLSLSRKQEIEESLSKFYTLKV